MDIVTMNEESAAESFAGAERRAEYIRAMHELAEARQPGTKVRVYVSVPPDLHSSPVWSWRFRQIRKSLPANVRLPVFASVFGEHSDGQRDYDRDWESYLQNIDGLVLVGYRPIKKLLQMRVGPVARRELRTVVATGRPVFVQAWDRGLVPLVDCNPVKTENPGQEGDQLGLRVPPSWSPQAETLRAALAAVTPKPAPEEIGSLPASRQPAGSLAGTVAGA
ncbi:hypothetical protein [Streptomyces decoyicus]